MRLLVYYLLLINSMAFVHHSIRGHHARPPDLGYSTCIAVAFVVLPMRHGRRRSYGLPCVVVTSAISAVIGHCIEI